MRRPGRRLARAAGVLWFACAGLLVAASHGCSSPGCEETADCTEADSDGAVSPLEAAAPDAPLGPPMPASDATPGLDSGSLGPKEASAPPPDGSAASGSDASHDAPSTPDACGAIEDCSNGVDDDCNGKVDCGDPACQPAFLCAAVAPAGWSGPVDLFDADSGVPPACASPYAAAAFDGTADPIAPPATCGCTCNPPSSATCGSVTVGFFFDSSCKNACTGTPVTVTPGGACVTGCPGALTMRASPPAATGGTCTGNASKSVPPLGWGHTARACAPGTTDAPGGCGAGALCVARPPAPFAPALCVWRAGDLACPAGPYAVRSVYYAGANDTRDCTACTCDASGQTCSAAQISTYADGECPSNPAGTILGDGSCVSAPGSTSVVRAGPSSPSASGCTPKPVSATGTVVPTGATTVCCTP
ncbi:MAG TPA: hypothetical protein VGI39_10710 [Polyangiaceae bacterium]